MRSRLIHSVASGLVVFSIGLPSLWAQEAGFPGEGGQAAQRQAENVPVALDGYCAVCLMRGHRWVKGKPEHTVVYDGRRYFFPGEHEKRAFLKAPSQYAPVLNGDSVVADTESGQRVPGNIRHARLYEGRLYLFQNEAEKRRFAENADKYAGIDVAYGGRCAVCRSNGGNVPGKPQFAARYHGMRYWFPSAKQREQFLAQPDIYAVESTSAGDAKTRASQQIAVRGTTTCATCEYGVSPLGAKETLGLAVETSDGKVYIVEDAHQLYPKIYEGRFQELLVELKGQVLQTKGKFVWVKPTSVKTLR